jgi:hypothetical protein
MRTKGVQLVRKALILTTSYVPGDGVGAENDVVIDGANQLVLFLNVTKGSLTSLELKIEFKIAGYGLFQELAASVSAGTATLTPLEYTLKASTLGAESKVYLAVPVLGDTARIHAKGTGTVTSSELAIFAAVGVI